MQKMVIGVASIVFAVSIFAFIPTTYEKTIRDGTDEFNAHHLLWGERVKSVTEFAVSSIQDVGVILVNIRHVPALAPVTLTIQAEKRGVVGKQTLTLPAFIDDEFTWFYFDSVIVQKGEKYTVEVSAPSAPQDAPVGVRFDAKSKALALSVHERIPVWEQVVRWTQKHHTRFLATSYMVIGGVLLAALFFLLEYIVQNNRTWGIVLGLLLLMCVTLYLRIPLSNSIDSAYGGDAFNYIFKGMAWINGSDPFSADARKAPLYPFLIIPGLLPGLDPILWARGVSIVASVATVLLVSLCMIRLGTPLSLALGAGMLLTVNRDYQFESVQGLSNPLYAALIMACAYVFLLQRRYLVSVFVALAALTRYEGIAAAGILLPSLWVTGSGKLRTMLREVVPFLVLGSIPFLLTPFTGAIGVRTFSDIAKDEGLYIAYSWDYFLPSIEAFKIFFGRLWILSRGVGDVFAAYMWGVVAGLVGSFFVQKYTYVRKVSILSPTLIALGLIYGTLWGDGSEIKLFIALFAALGGIGTAAAVYYKPRVCLPVVLMVLIQTAVITAILPKNRYYLHIIPFIAMAVVGGLWMVAGAKKASKGSLSIAVWSLCMMIALVYANANEHLSGQVSDYNEKSAEQTVLVNAGRYLKKESGIVAMSDMVDVRIYVPTNRILTFPRKALETTLQYEKMKDVGVAFLLETAEHPYFEPLLKEMPEKFQKMKTFTTRWSDTTATIYRVH